MSSVGTTVPFSVLMAGYLLLHRLDHLAAMLDQSVLGIVEAAALYARNPPLNVSTGLYVYFFVGSYESFVLLMSVVLSEFLTSIR